PTASARGCITPPTPRCGSSTRWSATRWRPATMRRCASCCPRCSTSPARPRAPLPQLLPVLLHIPRHTLRGPRFGIRIDPADGLFTQGADGYQLTWMDAKVGDWVVTPRRGKAVELNALWYNALCLMQTWTQRYGGGEGLDLAEHARRARESFNTRFWYADGGYLYDVVDGEQGDEACCRPNQVLSIALPHPVLDRGRWEPVMK